MDQIKALLQNKRNLEAEYQYLLTKLNDHRFKDTASIESRLQYVSDLLSRIQYG